MKKFFFLLLLAVFFCGCASVQPSSSQSYNWTGDIKRARQRTKGTIRIISVSAERSGEWGSLEKEALHLLPLLFSEKKYVVVPVSAAADYTADVKIRERQYTDGLHIKRSLSVEVRLWKGNTVEPLPFAASRVLINGKLTLAKSETLNEILREAVGSSVRWLPRIKK